VGKRWRRWSLYIFRGGVQGVDVGSEAGQLGGGSTGVIPGDGDTNSDGREGREGDEGDERLHLDGIVRLVWLRLIVRLM
jgi:hypothetical protein